MAHDWLKVREDLHEDPAVLAIAYRLETRPEHVVGYCIRFWAWASRNVSPEDRDKCPAGSVTGVPIESVESVLNVPGFLAMLVEVGWLDYEPPTHKDGSDAVISVPKFERHLSESSKKRALEAEKKRKQRKTSPKDVPKKTGQVSRNDRDKSGTRGEESRGEKNKDKNPPNPPRGNLVLVSDPRIKIPEYLLSQKGRERIQEWLDYRREIKKPLKSPKSLHAAFNRFASYDAFSQAVIYSMSQGWTGLFEERNGESKNQLPSW